MKTPWLLPLITVVLLSSGCSLILDLEECETSAECTEKFGLTATCSSGICDVPSVTSPHCQTSLGNPGAPNTLTIGVILALSGSQEGNGTSRKNAIEVAYNDLEKIKINGSDLAVLFCDDQSTLEGSLASAKHLTDVLKVPAIIGPQFSDHVKPVQNITKASKTVLVMPSASAALISTLDDDNLVWRTAPSDTFQAVAIARLLAATYKSLNAAGKTTDHIWVLTAGDGIYTGGLRDGLTKNFPDAIAQHSVKSLNYPVDNLDSWVNENLKSLPSPDIVIILGFTEAWNLAQKIKDFSTTTEPIFIMADGGKNQRHAKQFDELAQHVIGTAPQSVGDRTYGPYTAFRSKYLSANFKGVDQTSFLPHAYDALYLIAIAAGANGFTGPEIAEGLARMSEGEEIDPTREGVEKAFSILRKSSTATVNYKGASGKLDFDENGDPSQAPISLWCFDGNNLDDENILLSEENVFSFDPQIIFAAEGCLKPLVNEEL